MADTILVERDGPIATVVLNRPEKLNALTRPMWKRLGVVFDELSADDAVRCIIIRGAGTKAFAPGNDISEFQTERSNVEQARAYGADMRRTIEAIDGCRHPVVAQIHGICVGGGLEIAALCDLRICGESSRFGAPIKNLGLVMAYPEIGALVDLVGRTVALEILRQHPGPIDAVFVAIGGGGLVSGVAAYIKSVRPEIKVIGVQTTDSDAMVRSVDAGKRITLSDVGLFSDGTAVKLVGEETFRLTRTLVDEFIRVDTDAVCAAIKDIFDDTRSVMEPAGALAVAGLRAWVRRTGTTGARLAVTARTMSGQFRLSGCDASSRMARHAALERITRP